MPDERPYRTSPRHDRENRSGTRKEPRSGGQRTGAQLIAVQSISCVVIILIALVMRFAGGEAFQQLRQSFNESVMDNSIMATLAALIESGTKGGDLSGGTDPSASGTAPTSTDPTTGETEPSATEPQATEPASGTGTAAPAMGGKDIEVNEKKVLYAPEGATFAHLRINQAAKAPLPSGKITSWFGYRENPTKEGEGFHLGLDIGADTGTSISSMFFGVVTETGESESYGNYIKISHGGGIEVMYAHCSQILAAKDAVIRAGETVARVGSTGDTTGPHLHVEIRLNGTAYDPADVVPINLYA
ncbi:MAG: M23 family metallopeptidase [Clostridiales bacterium]|nr:M23 family metallopeptidase [Clostridiales bacterium]